MIAHRQPVNKTPAVTQLRRHLLAIPPDPTPTLHRRNLIIRTRAAAGISQASLARPFGITYQRVHPIVHGRRK